MTEETLSQSIRRTELEVARASNAFDDAERRLEGARRRLWELERRKKRLESDA